MIFGAVEEEITKAVEKLSESVVSIDATTFARRGFRPIPVEDSGSGLVFREDGYILTNNHVVEDAHRVQINLKSNEAYQGKIVGRDPLTDVALIKINSGNLTPASLGDSEKLKVGQLALAIGNSLGLPGGPTVSAGVISAIGRQLPGTDFILEGFLQTDAAINPGNSGGPLADIQGHVVGLNTAMIPFARGVGFAIPINTTKHSAQQILESGRVIRPWLGISGASITPQIAARFGVDDIEKGVLVLGVVQESPAFEAGLRYGDVITKIGDSEIDQMKDVMSALSKLEIGEKVVISILRNGSERNLSLRLIEMPEELYPRFRVGR